MPELKDAVAAAVARWWELKGLCTAAPPMYCKDGYLTVNGQFYRVHDLCHGTGYFQPAIVKALIEAVTVPCPCYPGFNYCHDSSCCCDGTGRVLRDWEEMPGALEGVIKHSVREALGKRNLSSEEFFLLQVVTNSRGDSDTLAAVDKAVKQLYGGKSK